jgi:Leucine-rich repeat (LRR) protein
MADEAGHHQVWHHGNCAIVPRDKTLMSLKFCLIAFFALSLVLVVTVFPVSLYDDIDSRVTASYSQQHKPYGDDVSEIMVQGNSLCDLGSSLPDLTVSSSTNPNPWSDSTNCPTTDDDGDATADYVPVWCSTPWTGVICDGQNRVTDIDITGLNSNMNDESSTANTIPSTLGTGLAGSLTHLDLSTNSLRGSLPPQLGQLTSLSYLGVGYNSLTGSLPPGLLGGLAGLTAVHLEHNSLTGTLPSDVYGLGALQELYLVHNQFSGTLSHSLERLHSLQVLFMYHNKISGTIPTQLAKLHTSLRQIGLGQNQLTGTLSHKLSALTNLHTLRVQYNSLTGTVRWPSPVLALALAPV